MRLTPRQRFFLEGLMAETLYTMPAHIVRKGLHREIRALIDRGLVSQMLEGNHYEYQALQPGIDALKAAQKETA